MAKKKIKIDISKHVLVPKHTKLSDKDTKKLLDQYNISLEELPKIFSSDFAIRNLEVQIGDVIKVERASPTAGSIEYYRCVIDG